MRTQGCCRRVSYAGFVDYIAIERVLRSTHLVNRNILQVESRQKIYLNILGRTSATIGKKHCRCNVLLAVAKEQAIDVFAVVAMSLFAMLSQQ